MPGPAEDGTKMRALETRRYAARFPCVPTPPPAGRCCLLSLVLGAGLGVDVGPPGPPPLPPPPIPAPILNPAAQLARWTFWDNRDGDWFAAQIPFFESPDS